MTGELPERNWNITNGGAASVILIALGFITYLASSIPVQRPVIMAAAAGILFAFSSKIGALDRLKTLMKPLSGFLNMAAGALLVASALLFFSSSLQIAIQTFSQFQGDSIIALVRAVLLPLIGYTVVLFGSFIAATGSSLVYWDRVDERVPVGADRTDFIFTGILAAITVLGVFGTAFLRELPIGNYIQSASQIMLSDNSFATVIAGIMIFVTYRAVRAAWKALPIRESIPRNSRDQYDKLKKPEKIARWTMLPLLAIGTALQGFVNIQYLNYLAPLSSSGFRGVMVSLTAVSIAVYLAVKLLKTLTGDRERIKRLIPYTLFGVVAYLSAPLLANYITPVLSQLPQSVAAGINPVIQAIGMTQFAMVVMTLASGAAVVLKIWMGILRGFGLVPRGLEGTTLAASGVFFSAIGLHLYQPDAVVLFIGVAAAMALWEMGKRSVILGREIGRSGSTYQTELVQLVSKLVIGFVAVVVARTALIAVNNVSFSSPSGSTGLIVFLLTVTGIGLLTVSMKEYT